MAKIKNKNFTVEHKESLLVQYKKNYQLLFFLLPGLIALILFSYMPMYGLLIAFKDYKFLLGVNDSPWVGFEHFISLFTRLDFLRILKNTFSISLLKLIFGFPAPILLALCMNEVKNMKFKKTVQTFSYLPHFFSWVILSGIIAMLFSVDGPVNIIMKQIGFDEGISFYGDSAWFVFMLIFTHVWQSMGWGSIIYLAALSGIDQSLYEAAEIDGAGKFKQLTNITLPCIKPTIATVFILGLGNVLSAGFDQILNMYNPTVYEVADILDTYVLRCLQSMDYGVGTAVGLFKSLVGLVFVLSANKIVKVLTDNESGIF